MSLINFTKSQGLGNDFIVIDNLDGRLAFSPALIEPLCDRHFGIGADGLILVERSKKASYFMNYYNVDGTTAEMCGNGIRVFAKYIYDHIEKTRDLKVETRAGIKEVGLRIEGDEVREVFVDMGRPVWSSSEVPVITDRDTFINQRLPLEDGDVTATAVSMGNPHCVIFVDSVADAPVTTLGPVVERLSIFPAKTNVEFVELAGPDELRVRVWERGVGETLACGTGACAAAVAAQLAGAASGSVKVVLRGGVLDIEKLAGGTVRMTGPAREVFNGCFDTDYWTEGERD